jgi:hypothetical protein
MNRGHALGQIGAGAVSRIGPISGVATLRSPLAGEGAEARTDKSDHRITRLAMRAFVWRGASTP